MSQPLYLLSAEFVALREQLEAEDLPPQVLADTLEGLAMPVEDKARNVAAYILDIDAEADKIDAAIQRLQNMKKAVERRADGMRTYLRQNMARCGITEIAANDGTFKIHLYKERDASVVIDDAELLPVEYTREIPAKVEPDKALIKKAIGDGYEVPGAHIEKRDRLVIK